jgi:hypothetical protein
VPGLANGKLRLSGLGIGKGRVRGSIGLGGHGQFFLAGGTLNLARAPEFVAFDVLPAVSAGKFYISHSFGSSAAGAAFRHRQVESRRWRQLQTIYNIAPRRRQENARQKP